MPHPDVKVEIAFNTSGTETWYEDSPSWTNVTSDVLTVTVERGRSRDAERFGASNAIVVLENNDRKYDPWNPSSVYYVAERPYRRNLIRNCQTYDYDYDFNYLDATSFYPNSTSMCFFEDSYYRSVTFPFPTYTYSLIYYDTVKSEDISVSASTTYTFSAYLGLDAPYTANARVFIEY